MGNRARRLSRLRESLENRNIDAILISKPENIRYLSGFTGSNGRLLISPGRCLLLTDLRYKLQAQEELEGPPGEGADFEIKIGTQAGELRELAQLFLRLEVKKVGFEAHFISLRRYQELGRKLPQIEFVPLPPVVEKLRAVKEEAEIANISEAADIGDKAFSHILTFIKPGATEKELALELEFFMRRRGAEKASFDVVVASGEHSAMPHAKTTAKKLKPGELVKLDFGATYQGYHSDMTRTVVLGKANQRQKKIYNLVLEAQRRALSQVRPGKTGAEIDGAARDCLIKAGYKEEFGHNLGHGVGLEVHESPILGPQSREALQAKMVFTVEPGLYFSGFGGVRIEDLMVLREEGPEILTKSPKELIEL